MKPSLSQPVRGDIDHPALRLWTPWCFPFATKAGESLLSAQRLPTLPTPFLRNPKVTLQAPALSGLILRGYPIGQTSRPNTRMGETILGCLKPLSCSARHAQTSVKTDVGKICCRYRGISVSIALRHIPNSLTFSCRHGPGSVQLRGVTLFLDHRPRTSQCTGSFGGFHHSDQIRGAPLICYRCGNTGLCLCSDPASVWTWWATEHP